VVEEDEMSGNSRNGLLMDLDGTIADTLPHLFLAFRHAVEPFVDRLPTDAEIVATFGPPERDCLARLLPRDHASFDQMLAAVAERFHSYYEGRHQDVKAFPGIAEIVRLARQQGWRFGVFTGKGRRSAIFTLEQLGLWQQVECLVTGDDVHKPKPDPEGVLLAMRQLGVEADQLIVVGDHAADVLAGNAVGARTAAALWGSFDANATRQAGPTWALERVEELRPLLISGRRSPATRG
jgi:HAD superfamily hydrolase (TIGR01509 family)